MPRWKREEYMDASGAWRMPDDDYIDYSGYWRTVDDFYVDASGAWRACLLYTSQYIKKNYPEPQFAINWFGGEPLMNFEIMKYITEELKKAGYDLIAHITTNGSLLTEEMLEYFQKEYSDLSFQITIDEIGEKYGKIKRYVDIDAKDAYKLSLIHI